MKPQSDSKESKTQKATLWGSFVAAIIASLCCIGPIVAVALGAGGFAASAFFEKWRPIFLGITFVLLALAWVLTYRKPNGSCEDGSVCVAKTSRRWSKVILWAATVLIVAMAAFPSLSSVLLRGVSSSALPGAADTNSAVLTLKIPSMDCGACAVSIQNKLRKHAGVQRADVNFTTKEAVIYYDAAKVSSKEIISAVDETGFKAEPTTGGGNL